MKQLTMKRVSVVGTVHEESGLANVSGLLAILGRIEPEVIFLEMPLAAFDAYFNGTRSNLESTAVRGYGTTHHVDLVPVDLPTPEDGFFRNARYLHETIERRSPEYRRVVDWHTQYVRAYGFAYLNSDDCSRVLAQVHEAILTTIAELGDRRLGDLYDSWNRTEELRDKAMVANIEHYCREISFGKAGFLVGAAHRPSIIDISRRQSGADSLAIQWDFAGFLQAPNRESGE